MAALQLHFDVCCAIPFCASECAPPLLFLTPAAIAVAGDFRCSFLRWPADDDDDVALDAWRESGDDEVFPPPLTDLVRDVDGAMKFLPISRSLPRSDANDGTTGGTGRRVVVVAAVVVDGGGDAEMR